MCEANFKVKKYVWYGNECHHFVTYSKCQLLTYHTNLLIMYGWFTAILTGIFTTRVYLKKKICVATMAKTQQSFFNYYNEIVSFCDKIELGAAYFLHNLITFFIPSRQRISEQIPYLC